MRRIILSAGTAALLLLSIAGWAQERAPAAPGDGHGHAITPLDDTRAVITLSEVERAFIKREMRGLLESVRDMLLASSAGDRAGIAAAGRRAGMNGPEKDHIPPSLAPKLPPEFKKLGLGTHRAFDQIAVEAEQGGDSAAVPKRLGELMGNCIVCHSTWRVADEAKR